MQSTSVSAETCETGRPMTPDHACVILRDAAGRFLLEERPADARHAAGQWTCFGGKREPHEDAASCARRELVEELGWAPDALAPAVDLWVGGRHIAHFYFAPLDRDAAALRLEPGRRAVLLAPEDLGTAPLSSWHRAVLRAFLEGRTRVDLPRGSESLAT